LQLIEALEVNHPICFNRPSRWSGMTAKFKVWRRVTGGRKWLRNRAYYGR